MATEVFTLGSAGGPTLVFLHEGLGSVSAWRDFPQALCRQCALPGLVYSRYGYGQSTPFFAPLDSQFMHHAADVELTQVLADNSIEQPILIGHSDGASIALLYAGGAGRDPNNHRPLGVVAMAPHLFVEPICTQAISELKSSFAVDARLRTGMDRHHQNGELTFNTWTNAWLEPVFADWNIESAVMRIECPVLGIQGREDQYGTVAHVEQLVALAPNADSLILEDCGHSPHQNQREQVMRAIERFVAGLLSDA